MDGHEKTILTPKALVPALFVEMKTSGINGVEEARVPDMDLIWRYSYYGTCTWGVSHGALRRMQGKSAV
jgi:hypothetical protein